MSESGLETAVSGIGWALVLLAIAVLIGWTFHIQVLTSLAPGLATLKPNTAVAFLLTGVCLLRRNHLDARFYAAAVLLLGLLTGAEYLFGLELHLDQLLVRDPYSLFLPGRMSQLTTLGFLFVGTALLLMKTRSTNLRRWSRGLGLLAGVLGCIAILGYSYDTQALYQVRPYSSIALHTAIAFVLAAVALQIIEPSEGTARLLLADNAGGAMLRKLLPSALLIPYLLGFLAWVAHRHLGWEMGFSLALLVAATMSCMVVIVLWNARRLERDDLKLRELFASLQEQTVSLQRHRDLLKIFVKHVPAAVAMLDRDMRYLQVSDRWCSDYALDSSQMLGRMHYEIFPDLPQRWKEIYRRGLAGETMCAEADRWDREDGTTTWLHWEIRPWGHRNGLPEGILIFSEDITSRKQVEELLRESEATIRALLETAAQGILAIDANGKIVLANHMAGAMFGYEANQLTGSFLEQLVPQRFAQQHTIHRDEFFINPRTRSMNNGRDLLGLRKDGSEFPIEVSLSVVNTARGPLAVSLISDITARQEAQSALRESEQQLRVLAGSLITAQEDERRRLSRDLHDDITQRLALLSMELGKLAEDPSTAVSAKQSIRDLQRQTLAASDEVRRISHGLHPALIEDFGLSTALEEFCHEFEKAQHVRVSFEGDVERELVDPNVAACFYRIAQECLRNAVVHGQAGRIDVSLQQKDRHLQLRVADNGAGFSTHGPKSGLGLISMRERIRLVNGSLSLESQPGKGTTVTASIPIGASHE